MRFRYPLVSTLFFVSGATGLLYEVAFSKLLAYVFGATAYAVSTVLASFMAGLALGAHFGGRWGARPKRPLLAYGGLEITVGLVCAASPFALGLVTDAYVSLARSTPSSLALLTVLRAALTAAAVIVPTMAMGATLPILSRIVAGSGDGGGRRLSDLYAINTAGGALGALAGAYVILPTLGVRGTMLAAAITNVTIGAIAAIAGKSEAQESERSDPVGPVATRERGEANAADASPTTQSERSDSVASLLLGLAFASGFLVFAAEVVETHLLALLIGNSAYAFGLMLAVFLVCLAAGAARSAEFAKRHGDRALARGLAVAGLSVAITLPLWDQLPRIFSFAGSHVSTWAGREFWRALAALVILALPTYWMGTTFPLLLAKVAARVDVARQVGRLTVANTLGTIVGSIVTGYAVLPALGSQGSLRAIAVAFGAAALFALPRPRAELSSGARYRSKLAMRDALPIAAGFAFALFLPRWDLARLTNGANVYFSGGHPADAIEFVREDVHGGVTTVARIGKIHALFTNGKFQGDDDGEMTAQRRFAHFPSLFVDRFDRALVIGLGTGTTIGTLAQYPWKRIDLAEISPSIVEASRLYFKGPNFDALDDPRIHVELNDGRNHLLVATEPYDLVTIELTSVWFAGAANLYSREFYELVKARLTPGGVLQQWVQLHHIRRRELAATVRTLRSSFDHVALFIGGGQGILVASAAPLHASTARLEMLEARPGLHATLEGKSLSSLFGELVASEGDLDRFVEQTRGGPIISTDDNLYLEYATPKGNVFDKTALEERLAELETYRTPDPAARHLTP